MYDDTTISTRDGSVYIYDIDGNFITKLLEPTIEDKSYNQFGWAVAIYQNTIVVGCPFCNGVGNYSGTLYIYDKNGVFIRKITLESMEPEVTQELGYSVAVYGNYIVAGAPYDATITHRGGSFYIFHIDGTFIAKITDQYATITPYLFAITVSIFGNQIVIGNQYRNNTYGTSGDAQVFDTSGNFQFRIPIQEPSAEYFGSGIANNSSRICVLALSGDSNDGSAYLYQNNGTFIKKLPQPPEAINQGGGYYSIAMSEEFIFIGSYNGYYNNIGCGLVFVFNMSGDYIKTIIPTNLENNIGFGYSVGVSTNKLVVGVPWYNADNGKVVVYKG